jgi:hypothetical protein
MLKLWKKLHGTQLTLIDWHKELCQGMRVIQSSMIRVLVLEYPNLLREAGSK